MQKWSLKIEQKRFGVYAIVSLWKKVDEISELRNHAWREKDRGTHVQTSGGPGEPLPIWGGSGSGEQQDRRKKRKKEKGRKSSWKREENN